MHAPLITVVATGLLGAACAQPLQKVLFSSAVVQTYSARCLDGSSAGFFFRAGSSTEWVVYLQGGGECYTQSSCAARAKSALGSSNYWPATFTDVDNVLSTDATKNPALANANHVYVPYCSGDVWTGARTTATGSTWGFYFSGHLILRALVDTLVNQSGLGAGSRLLLSGGSAGGIGAFTNVDAVASWLPTLAVSAAPQGGFFFPRDIVAQPEYAAGVTWPPAWVQFAPLFDLYDSVLPAACVAVHNRSWCGTLDHSYAYIKAPLFIAENVVDSQQVFTELLAPTSGPALTAFISYFAGAMRTSLSQVNNGTGDGLWAPACFDHTGDLNFRAPQVRVNGVTYSEALSSWWRGDSLSPRISMDTCNPVPCNPGCPPASTV